MLQVTFSYVYMLIKHYSGLIYSIKHRAYNMYVLAVWQGTTRLNAVILTSEVIDLVLMHIEVI